MIRFVIQCDTRYDGSDTSYHFDLTLDIPELEKVLSGGGRNTNGDFERYSLKIAYPVLDKDPITSTEDYVKGINDLYDFSSIEQQLKRGE